ncbi:MAG: hypothetical protein P9L97_09340 [Candidatus Tenebribacter davisii]|nr:hypothetical protein [Candidatus Tenebribacter davisii]
MKIMLVCGFLLVIAIAFGIKSVHNITSGDYAFNKTGHKPVNILTGGDTTAKQKTSNNNKPIKSSNVSKMIGVEYYKLKNIAAETLGGEFSSIQNTIILSPKDSLLITNLLNDLDVRQRHYFIKVYLVEININKTKQSGFSYVFDSLKQSDNSLFLSIVSDNTFSFISDKFDVSAFLIDASNNVNVISEPVLLVKQGSSSSMSAFSDTPVISSINYDTETKNQVSNYSYKKIGIELDINVASHSTSSNCFISLNQETSYISGYEIIDNNSLPIVASRLVESEFCLQKYETIVLSTVRQSINSTVISGVPVLSSIPIIGGLFRNSKIINNTSDLVIMIELVYIK